MEGGVLVVRRLEAPINKESLSGSTPPGQSQHHQRLAHGEHCAKVCYGERPNSAASNPAFFIATVLQAEPPLCHPVALPLPSCECPAPSSAYCTQAYRPSIWLDLDYMSDGHTCTKWPLIFFKLTIISKCKTLSPPAAA